MAKEQFDVIVIGGGPAGNAAAYTLAKNNFKVCLIERGDYLGTKNVMGGILYSRPTADILPEFYKEAPLERNIVEQQYWLLKKESAVKFSYRDQDFASEPYNCFSVLRAKFDEWFAGKVDEAGVYVIPKTQVTDFIKEDGRFVGVITDRPDGELRAKVIILAEGANAMLSVKAGLSKPLNPKTMALAVKQIIFLPEEKISDRFNVQKDQGVAIEMLGEVLEGMIGVSFLYSNKNTISIGIGALISDFVKTGVKPYELIERVKEHPCISPYIKDGIVREYLAHLISERGFNDMPQMYDNGILVVGDAGALMNPVHREGSNLAMTSGKLAAETIIEVSKKGDFSKENLSVYMRKLENSFIIKDMRKYRNTVDKWEKNQAKIDTYADWAMAGAKEIFTVDSVAKTDKQRKIIKSLIKEHGYMGLIKDGLGLRRFLNEN